MASKYSRERRSHTSLNLNQMLEMIKLGEDKARTGPKLGEDKARTGPKPGLLCQTVNQVVKAKVLEAD